MSVQQLRNQVSQQQGQQGQPGQNGGSTTTALDKPKTKAITFPDMLEQYKSQIAMALPKHLNPDRMSRIALTEFRKNPELGNCDPRTVFASIIMAAQLGLEPGVMGQCYLIPYKGTCTFVPGWQGYVDLVSRSGRASVWTDAVRKGDRFTFTKGSSPSIDHAPGENVDDDSPFTYVYAVGRIRSAEWPIIEIWSRNKVQKHLAKYNKVGQRHYALQNERNLEMYGRKIALLNVIKYMPKSIEVAQAAGLDHQATAGVQNIDMSEAINGLFLPSGSGGSDDDSVIEGQPQTGAPEDPQVARMNECFALLTWNDGQQAKWLETNKALSFDEKIAKLEKILND